MSSQYEGSVSARPRKVNENPPAHRDSLDAGVERQSLQLMGELAICGQVTG
jgi:hypothetical protein